MDGKESPDCVRCLVLVENKKIREQLKQCQGENVMLLEKIKIRNKAVDENIKDC